MKIKQLLAAAPTEVLATRPYLFAVIEEKGSDQTRVMVWNWISREWIKLEDID